jgi:hypothetical protein
MDLAKRADAYAVLSLIALSLATALTIAVAVGGGWTVESGALPRINGLVPKTLLTISVTSAAAGCVGMVAAVATQRTAVVWVVLVVAGGLLVFYAPATALLCYITFT